MKPNIFRSVFLSLTRFLSNRLLILFLYSFLGLYIFACVKNENPPEVNDQEFFLDENSPIGTIIGAINASDVDENTLLSFTILDGNTNSAFRVDENTGLLSVSNPEPLDFEKTTEFILKIQVNDNHPSEPKISEAIVKVYLNDLNEFAPLLDDHTFEMEEFPPKDSLIGIINASDEDSGQTLIFSIESGNDGQAIRIDSLSGEVFVSETAQFDVSINKTIKCMISVSDNHPISPKKDYALLTVEIKESGVTKVNIKGNVQKGPFIQGSVIVISELNEQMEPTGRTFNTSILDNSGSFELYDVSLKSKYVQINASGFYFNERSGELSEAQLSLYCIADLSNLEYSNVNILSHLEYERIKYLIKNGNSFEEAKAQAQHDVLAIFSISDIGLMNSELMDISKAGDDNAILLAASVILQSFKSTADFSELLNRISSDIKTDGILDNQALGIDLVNSVKFSNMANVRKNLESRYNELTVNYTIPEFEKYITYFLENTSFEASNDITFPSVGYYGNNSLHPDSLYVESQHTFNKVYYSLCADVPEGRSLKVRITGRTAGLVFNSEKNLEYTFSNDNIVLTANTTGPGKSDLKMFYQHEPELNPSGKLYFEYFSDGIETPFFTKYVTILPFQYSPPDTTSYR